MKRPTMITMTRTLVLLAGLAAVGATPLAQAGTLPGLAEAAADPLPVVDVVAALLGLRLR